jgi:hypothetical protein
MPKIRCIAFFSILLSLFAFSGCDPDMDTGYDYYDLKGSESVSSCRVFYPASLATGKDTYPAVTLSGGMSNTKESMYWLAEYLSKEKNIIVFTISAVNNMLVIGYTKAHLDGYEMIVAENDNPESIVYQRIHSYGLMGYSMGGGAVLNAGDELGDAIDAVVAMAPFNPDRNLNGMIAKPLMIVGQNDLVANAKFHAEPAYDDLPDTMDKCLMELKSFFHSQWSNNHSGADTPKLLISSWLDMEMNGNTDRIETFLNAPNDVTLNWNNLE